MQGWYGLGRIGRLEEVDSRSDNTMAKFSLAIDEYNSKKGEKETTWLNCICFGKTADFVLEYFEVGKPIFVRQGRVSVNEWVDDDDNKRRSYDIIVDRVDFVPGGDKEGNGSSGSGRSSKSSKSSKKRREPDNDYWNMDDEDDPFSDD